MRLSYQKYLKSSLWQQKKGEALKRAKNRCQVCNSDKRLEVHHRKYPIRLGDEPIEDLTVLCKDCHELYTFKVQKYVPPIKYKKSNIECKPSPRWDTIYPEEAKDRKQVDRETCLYKELKEVKNKMVKNLKAMRRAQDKSKNISPYLIKQNTLLLEVRRIDRELHPINK